MLKPRESKSFKKTSFGGRKYQAKMPIRALKASVWEGIATCQPESPPDGRVLPLLGRFINRIGAQTSLEQSASTETENQDFLLPQLLTYSPSPGLNEGSARILPANLSVGPRPTLFNRLCLMETWCEPHM